MPKPRWLLLIHAIPPHPAYLRVKVGRQLARAGAVAIKNSVYALPATESGAETLAWVRREVTSAGGEASVIEGRFVDGLSDEDVERLFRQARDADYATLVSEIRTGVDVAAIERFRHRLQEIEAIDFFRGASYEKASRTLAEAAARTLPGARAAKGMPARLDLRDFRGRIWVTREHVGVDRMASAWLIRRSIDAKARFRFVPKEAPSRRGELRFDMFDGDFTHEGDRCTFEVLADRFEVGDFAIVQIGEIIHSLDLEDGKFPRSDAAGIGRVISAIASAHASDERRLERAFALFDDLHALFSIKRSPKGAKK